MIMLPRVGARTLTRLVDLDAPAAAKRNARNGFWTFASIAPNVAHVMVSALLASPDAPVWTSRAATPA